MANPKQSRLQVVAEEAHLLLLDKPAGLAVHGGAKSKRSVVEILAESHGKIHLVHRLDRDTSGAMLVARSADVARALQASWPQFRKTYLALVHGALEGTTTVDAPIDDEEGKQQAARTRVTALHHLEGVSLVQAEIETGRKHQIRRHLAGIGHPIVMDDKHGDFRANKAFRRAVGEQGAPRPKYTMLHARRVVGPHPRRAEEIRHEVALPHAWKATWVACGGAVDVLAQVP